MVVHGLILVILGLILAAGTFEGDDRVGQLSTLAGAIEQIVASK